MTKNHATMKCYGLGLGLDTYRMVALDANFRRLQEDVVCRAYEASRLRVFFLDYDGTLTTSRSGLPHSSSSATSLLTLGPSGQVRQGGEEGGRQVSPLPHPASQCSVLRSCKRGKLHVEYGKGLHPYFSLATPLNALSPGANSASSAGGRPPQRGVCVQRAAP